MSANAAALFDTIPRHDLLGFGMGPTFEPRRVVDWLDLRKAEVSHLANVSPNSVRYDDAIPAAMRDRLEEVALTCNMVAEAFDGDLVKTSMWFKVANPNLGGVSPRDMVRLGRFDRLRKHIVNAMAERQVPRVAAE